MISQTYSNLEIIIINDGSTDETINILNKYKDSRIIIKSITNSGQGRARNIGLDIATGDIIAFLDADDYIDINCYSELMKKYNQNIDIIQFGFLCETNERCIPINYQEKIIRSNNDLLEMYITENNFYSVVWNKLYKYEIFNELRFREGIIYEDTDLLYEIMTSIKILKNVNIKPYHYIIHNDSTMTSSFNEKKIKDMFDVLDNIGKKINKSNPDYSKLFYAKSCMSAFDLLFQTKNDKINFKKIKKEYKNYFIDYHRARNGMKIPLKWKISIYIIYLFPKIMCTIYGFTNRNIYNVE